MSVPPVYFDILLILSTFAIDDDDAKYAVADSLFDVIQGLFAGAPAAMPPSGYEAPVLQ